MKYTRHVLILVLAAIALLTALPVGAQSAPPPEWNFIAVTSTSQCGTVDGQGLALGASVAVEMVNIQGMGTFIFDTIATWDTEVLMDEVHITDSISNGQWNWEIFDSNDRGLQTMSFADVPPGSTINVTMTLRDSSEMILDQDFFSFVCGTAVPASDDTDTVPVPGCDVSITIPSTAVGATIAAATPVYWKPGAASNQTFPADLNLLALGVDDSGMYTKVLYVCGTYWVPTGVIGPNYDEVWNGAPLPTGVVN